MQFYTFTHRFDRRQKTELSVRNIYHQMESSAAGSAPAAEGGDERSFNPSEEVTRVTVLLSRRYQHLLDKTLPHFLYRWIAFIALAVVYVVRVFLLQGFYVVSYALGIYILNLLIGFLSPQVDPELDFANGPTLPTRESDEFRPFVRRLPEFKFW